MTEPRAVTLADVHHALDELRANRAASPLGRYAAGRARARREVAAGSAGEAAAAAVDAEAAATAAEDEEDLRNAHVLTDALTAVVAGDEERLAELLAGLVERDPDLVTALQHWADLLATACARAGSGAR